MKDFRVNESKEGSINYGPIVGGSAFHLPDIVSPITSIARIIPTLGLAMLLRPWRLLPMLVFRRRGMVGAFFSWVRLISIIIALLFIISPLTVKSSIPEWRMVTIICFLVCSISVIGAIMRCCGSLVSCAFWSLLTLFLAEKAIKSEPFSAPVAEVPRVTIPIDGEWEDLVTGEPVAKPVIVRAQRKESVPQVKLAHAQAAAPANAGSSIFSIIPSTNSVFSSVGVPLPRTRDWVDGEALPESAYFGGGPKFGAIGEASGMGESGSPVDKVINQIGSYIGF